MLAGYNTAPTTTPWLEKPRLAERAPGNTEMPKAPAPDDVWVYEKPTGSARGVRIAAACVTLSLVLTTASIVASRPSLVFAVPLLIASLAGLGEAISFRRRSRSPAIVLSRDGLALRSDVVQTIPWGTIKKTTRFRSLTGTKLALVFDHDRIREASRGNMREAPSALLDITLVPSRYDVDINDLQQSIDQRIATAKPWTGELVGVQKRSPSGFAIPLLLLSLLAAFCIVGAREHFRDERIRARIAAPHYPRDETQREATALRDIGRYPRDTRVRYAFAATLVQDGRLADARTELVSALRDEEAIRVMSSVDHPRRRGFGLDLGGRVELLLAIVLAKQGDSLRAKQIASPLCRNVANTQMPTLESLDLCHYSGSQRRSSL